MTKFYVRYYKLTRWQENFWLFLARCIPFKLRYWATILSCAQATQGKWSDTVVTDLTIMDMLKRIERN